MLRSALNQDESASRLSSISVPLAASFVATVWAMVLLCRFELASTQSFRGILILPLVCLAVTAAMHIFAIVVIRGVMDADETLPARSLVSITWLPVVWVPALVVMANAGSAWVAVLLPLIAGLAAAVLLRRAKLADRPDDAGSRTQTLFTLPAAVTLRQTIFPLLIASLAAQLGLLAHLSNREWIGGFLFAAGCVILLWRFLPRKPRRVTRSIKPLAANSLAAFVLTVIAMIPYLKPGPGHDALERLLRMQQMKTVHASAHPNSSAGYSGVILTLPPKPHETVLPQPPDPALSARLAKPLLIRFDGAYWYFKEPDDRPGSDARVVRGDPLKANIHSTNSRPLLMEAHQNVLPAVQLTCCSAVQVNIVNADTRPGQISVEVILRDTESHGSAPVSLGTLPIVSSTQQAISMERPPVHETLSFQIPPKVSLKQFTEITLRIKPAKERSLAGSEILVESFLFVR